MLRSALIPPGRTQTSVAEDLGISPAYLSGLLTGKKRPSLDLAVKIERLTDGAVPVSSWVADPDHTAPLSDPSVVPADQAAPVTLCPENEVSHDQ